MRGSLWRIFAWFVSRPRIARWIVTRSHRTPYIHIHAADNAEDIYMGRWWVFNPYGKDARGGATPARWPWLPSIRVHHIMRPDRDRDLHDHPWNARTIILHGCYVEQRPTGIFTRRRGDTCTLKFGEYHRIEHVSEGGVTTLFFTWRYRGTWGFLVDGSKVPYREYLGLGK